MYSEKKQMKIGVIGTGWYGLSIALLLSKAGHEVVCFEKGSDIFSNVSGKFGIRLHAGPHYPRSPKTRESCLKGLKKFRERFPELVVDHEYSIYGLGEQDADNQPSHVNENQFKSVCEETKNCEEVKYCNRINPESMGFQHLIDAWNIDEPSIVLGERLREKFKEYLKKENIKIEFNYEVKELKKCGEKIAVTKDGLSLEEFDYIINATGYQAFVPDEEALPFKLDTYYQPLVGLLYKDKKHKEHPFSVIVMDGLFPCIMPVVDSNDKDSCGKYLLTHAKYTTLASCKKLEDAQRLLDEIDDNFILKEGSIKDHCESEMVRFWPEFKERFTYLGWKGAVLAKTKTNTEFRSAITFADKEKHIIYVFPGKVANIFEVEEEVEALLTKRNIVDSGNYQYMRNGILHQAISELNEEAKEDNRNACSQQTYRNMLEKRSIKTTPLLFHLVVDDNSHEKRGIVTFLDPQAYSQEELINQLPIV
jgi:hypothetical protein